MESEGIMEEIRPIRSDCSTVRELTGLETKCCHICHSNEYIESLVKVHLIDISGEYRVCCKLAYVLTKKRLLED